MLGNTQTLHLSARAWVIVACAVSGGLATLGLGAHALVSEGPPNWPRASETMALAVLLGASWARPLMVFVGRQSQALHLDECFLVALLLTATPGATIIAFAGAILVAQRWRPLPLVKSAFNVGQAVLSAGVGVGVFDAAHGNSATFSSAHIGAAAFSAIAYMAVNGAVILSIVVATGSPLRQALRCAFDAGLAFNAASIGLTLVTAVAFSAERWGFPLVVIPPLILRLVLTGHFEARRDRARVQGLFDAALAANRSMGHADVTSSLSESARMLLRCPVARLTKECEDNDSLRTRLPLADRELWLSVTGRSPSEPFDRSEQALLDTLAAMGAAALTNATLYEENRAQRERITAITSSMGEGVCALDAHGEITFLNKAAADMLSRKQVNVAVRSADADRLAIAPPCLLAPGLRAMTAMRTIVNDDTRLLRPDGSFLNVALTASPIVADGAAEGAVLVFRDITERKSFEAELARHAFHDALSGLPNRRLFLDHLDHSLKRAARSDERHAVLFADVDRFKLVNDNLGHQAGDHLLVAIAQRIQRCIRPGDLLSRFGGDEFTVLIGGVRDMDDAVVVARRIADAMREPIVLPDGHEVVASLSIGLALTSPGQMRDDVLHDADVAMYKAKARGHSGLCEIFDENAMGGRSADAIELEAELRHALEHDELVVHYQPMFSIVDSTIVGAEALVRWNHPTRGLLGPLEFIAAAEESGLILPLGRFVLREACHQARAWRERFGLSLGIGVNLSARQFQQPGLVEEVEWALRTTGVEPWQVCLEITESLALESATRTRETLEKLTALGVHVAVDDFGTGYSALGYLTSFPIDVVKVDRSFVQGIDTDRVKSAIVSAVISLSDALGTTTVVEGVETAEELKHLRSLGCVVVQGFYLGKPMDAAELGRFIEKHHSEAVEPALQFQPHPSRFLACAGTS